MTPTSQKTDLVLNAVERLETMLLGNGQKGLMNRVTTIEAYTEQANVGIAANLKAISDLTKTMADLTSLVSNHQKSPHLWSIMGKKASWVVLLLCLYTIHTVLEQTPSVLTWIVGLF